MGKAGLAHQNGGVWGQKGPVWVAGVAYLKEVKSREVFEGGLLGKWGSKR